MSFDVKQLGMYKIKEPVNDFNFTEHLYSWMVKVSEETINRTWGNLRFFVTKSFSVKDDTIDEPYKYDWKISLQKSQQNMYKLSIWLESYTDPQSADKKMYLSVTHILSNQPAYQAISQNQPVNLLYLGEKTEAEIPAEFFESYMPCSQVLFIHQFNIKAKVFWRETMRLSIDRMSADFAKLYNHREGSDVTLVFDDQKEIKVHKLILMARSSVFRAMFQNEMLETKENRVHIKDVDSNTFQELVQYIYTGKVCLETTDKLEELTVVADKYDLSELKVCCEDELRKNLNVENVSDVLVVAHLLDLISLKSKAIHFIVENKVEVLKTDGYKSLRDNYTHLLAELFEKLK